MLTTVRMIAREVCSETNMGKMLQEPRSCLAVSYHTCWARMSVVGNYRRGAPLYLDIPYPTSNTTFGFYQGHKYDPAFPADERIVVLHFRSQELTKNNATCATPAQPVTWIVDRHSLAILAHVNATLSAVKLDTNPGPYW